VAEVETDIDTTGLTSFEARLSQLIGRRYTVQVDTYTPQRVYSGPSGESSSSSSSSSTRSTVPTNARAAGGPVAAYEPYLVGEEGPEMVVPTIAGNVVPADMTARLLRPAAVGTAGRQAPQHVDQRSLKIEQHIGSVADLGRAGFEGRKVAALEGFR